MNVLHGTYFDGKSTRVREVVLSLVDNDLAISGDEGNLRVPFAQIQVDERLGRAARRLRLPDGTFVEVHDLEALDVLLAAAGHRDGHVDRMQRHLTLVLASCVAFILVIAAAYKWGLPLAAQVGAHHLPPAVGKTLSTQALKVLDGPLLEESKLPTEQRTALNAEFRALRLPEGGNPTAPLLFRRSPQLGANAFTLPDGTIVILDDLITSIGDDRQIMAVLAHELGHAYGRHGLQLLLQSSAVGAFWTLYIGDISNLVAAAPAAILQAKYSQDLERQADDYGASLLKLNGLSPGLLADSLQKLLASHPDASNAGYLSSHPSTDERMRHLRQLAVEFRRQ